MEAGLTAVGNVMTTAMSTISDNPLLMALFCTALVGAGFGLVRKAKNAVL